MSDFVKNASNAPKGHIAAEAAGLRWLAEPGAVPVVEVLEEEPGARQQLQTMPWNHRSLRLERPKRSSSPIIRPCLRPL